MSKLSDFAERELAIHKKLIAKDDKSIILPYREEILKIIKKFNQQGYTEESTEFAAKVLTVAIRNLLMQQIISPVTDDKDQWVLISPEDNMYQNKRCSGLFKEGIEGKPYFLDAIHWRLPNGSMYAGKALDIDHNIIWSRQHPIFPFSPHTFTIDVTAVDETNLEGDFYVKDAKQLEEVFQYYDRYEVSQPKV